VRDPAFLARAGALGERLRTRLGDLQERHPLIGEVRGLGPMLALELEERSPDRAKAVVEAAFERGLLLLSCGTYDNTVRFIPPLNVSSEQIHDGLRIFGESLKDVIK